MFESIVALVALAAGGVASVTGFGIGSLLTPALSLEAGLKVAVAAISIPHVVGTAVRFWLLRARVDRRVLLTFGLTSAAGSLAGALLHARATSPALTIVFGGLLLFVAASELAGLSRRLRFHGAVAWVAGALSGLLGGLVGNQGGIRSAALLGFALPKETFVATATAIGLIVDAARMPVYFAGYFREIAAIWPIVAVATAGVVAGTLIGARVLRRIPDDVFRRVVAVLLALLGAATIARA